MNWLKSITILFLILFSHYALATDSRVLQLFNGNNYNAVQMSDIDTISFDTDADLMILQKSDGNQLEFNYSQEADFVIDNSLPIIEITTDIFQEEITSKTVFSEGEFSLRGFGKYDDIADRVSIRGRGNSSWKFIKKPYRLKFNKKVGLCGLPAAKNYVLLANYADCSLLQNALAFKIGQLLELPYTNTAVPVDVIFNGIYKGSYILTNKTGINAGSVDIDEDNSIMWELDVAYDEDLKFKSPVFNLPVMVADPDLDEEKFEYWKNDFIQMERAVLNRNSGNYIDIDIAAKYVAVFEILKNDEIGFPKSFKLFKTDGGKYIMGPLWDFDVAMGKVWEGECFTFDRINKTVWLNELLRYLSFDPEFQTAYKKQLKAGIDKLPELLEFIDNYSFEIRQSALRNQELYPDYEDFDESVQKLKDWLTKRCEVLISIHNLEESNSEE